MPQVTIEFEKEKVDIDYVRNDVNLDAYFNVNITEEKIKYYTGEQFSFILKQRDNILVYPATHGETDLDIKGKIITEIFKKEQIDFL